MSIGYAPSATSRITAATSGSEAKPSTSGEVHPAASPPETRNPCTSVAGGIGHRDVVDADRRAARRCVPPDGRGADRPRVRDLRRLLRRGGQEAVDVVAPGVHPGDHGDPCRRGVRGCRRHERPVAPRSRSDPSAGITPAATSGSSSLNVAPSTPMIAVRPIVLTSSMAASAQDTFATPSLPPADAPGQEGPVGGCISAVGPGTVSSPDRPGDDRGRGRAPVGPGARG